MPKHKTFTKDKDFIDKLLIILSISVILLYFIQASNYTHYIQPVMDESSYLLKGKWFINGTYKPFQDYGPLPTYPPLSFISLGISQLLLDSGLESGRIIAVFYSVIMLVGLWLTVNRLRGKWWALFSVGLFVISPAWIIYYSRAMTQGISSLLVVWSLYFLLGEKKKNWEPYVGVILAAMTTMIRQNMLPYLGLVILYVIWMEGIRKGWKHALAGILIFILSNLVFLPRIYTNIYAEHLPDIINNAVYKLINIDPMAKVAIQKDFLVIDEIQVLFDGVRYYFPPVIATIATFIIPLKILIINKKYHNLIFLASSFLLLTGIHFLACVRENIFLYSFPAYIAFYLPLGIVLIPELISTLPIQKSRISTLAFACFGILITAGIGLGIREKISPLLFKLRVPSSTSLFQGEFELWDVLLTRFGIPISTQNYLLPVVAGVLIGLMILAVAGIVWLLLKNIQKPTYYLNVLFFTLFSLGLILSPTYILAGKGSIGVCENDVLERNKIIGEKLRSTLSPGARIYWEGNIPTPLLYLTDFKFHPVQLNMHFNFLVGGDPDIVERNGYWNDELAVRWIREADYLLLSPETAASRGIQSDPAYQEMFSLQEITESLNPCSDSTVLLIFKRIN